MSLSTSLVAYWSLEETSGTRVDATGRGNDLAPAAAAPTSNTGKVGTAAQFAAASGQYASIADNADLSMGDVDFTIAGWMYLDSLINATMVGKYVGTGNQRNYFVYYNKDDHATNNRFSFAVSSNGSAVTQLDATTFGAPSTATWYFVVAYHDSVNNVLGISVNDTLNTTSYSSGCFDSTAVFQLGAILGNATYPMSGRIDEVGIWKRVLSAAEITELYNSGNGRDYAYISAAAATGQPTMRRWGGVPGLPSGTGRGSW